MENNKNTQNQGGVIFRFLEQLTILAKYVSGGKIRQSGNDWLLSSPSIGVFLQVEQQPLGENQPESKGKELSLQQRNWGHIKNVFLFTWQPLPPDGEHLDR